jgi:fatty-acyl-CoA synthase
VANFLRNIGVCKGDRVAVLLMNCLEFMEIYFAANKIGAIFSPMNFRLTVSELSYILADAVPSVLFYGCEFQEASDQLKDRLKINNYVVVGLSKQETDGKDRFYETILEEYPDTEPRVSVNLEDPHLLMYTSGTTGNPKGAVITHSNTLWNSLNGQLAYPLSSDDITLVVAPLFHMGALNIFTTPTIHRGGTIYIEKKFDAEDILKVIENEQITTMFGAPTMFQMMMHAGNFDKSDLSSLKFLFVGGAPCPLAIIEAYNRKGVKVGQGYGLTETSPFVCLLPIEDSVRKIGSVGPPVLHVEVKIIDEHGNELGLNQVGEIITKGPHVFKEYWNLLDQTREAIVDGWFHTGDLGKMDEEGYYYLVDRKKDMIISGGENIYPAEVEKVLYQHPDVLDVAIIGIPDTKWGECPLAVIVAEQGADVTVEEIINYCQRNLASYKLPKAVVFVTELPRTPTGKVRKNILRQEYSAIDPQVLFPDKVR